MMLCECDRVGILLEECARQGHPPSYREEQPYPYIQEQEPPAPDMLCSFCNHSYIKHPGEGSCTEECCDCQGLHLSSAYG